MALHRGKQFARAADGLNLMCDMFIDHMYQTKLCLLIQSGEVLDLLEN